MGKQPKPYKRKIKCRLGREKCYNCPFRNETEWGIICNLPSRFWNSDLEVIVTVKKQYDK